MFRILVAAAVLAFAGEASAQKKRVRPKPKPSSEIVVGDDVVSTPWMPLADFPKQLDGETFDCKAVAKIEGKAVSVQFVLRRVHPTTFGWEYESKQPVLFFVARRAAQSLPTERVRVTVKSQHLENHEGKPRVTAIHCRLSMGELMAIARGEPVRVAVGGGLASLTSKHVAMLGDVYVHAGALFAEREYPDKNPDDVRRQLESDLGR